MHVGCNDFFGVKRAAGAISSTLRSRDKRPDLSEIMVNGDRMSLGTKRAQNKKPTQQTN